MKHKITEFLYNKIPVTKIEFAGSDQVRYTSKYKAYNYRPEFATANFDLECGFCGTEVTAYPWSLAGTGKRCPGCKCLHTGGNMSIFRSEKEWSNYKKNHPEKIQNVKN